MSRTRRSLLTAAVAATLIIATGLPAGAQPPTGGFLLSGTDAALAEWGDVNLGIPCDGGWNVFVAFVDADRFKQPLSSRPVTDHADVQARVTCGLLVLIGEEEATACSTAEIVELERAEVICDFPIGFGAFTAHATIALTWTATGDIFTETFNGPGMHAAHRTTRANIAGQVTINGTSALLAGLNGSTVGAPLFDDTRHITHYREIQIGSP